MSYSNETHKEACKRVWARMAAEHPEFTRAHDVFNDPWTVEGLILESDRHNIAFKPFPGAKVMDIGANAGLLSAYWALNGCEVTAYEADPETCQTIADMFIRTGLQVNVINKAIWSHTGEIEFTPGRHTDKGRQIHCGLVHSPSHEGASHSALNPERHKVIASTIMVPCITLAEALGDTIWDFVKMDIEGAEFEVLTSTPAETLRDHIKAMVVEFHCDWPSWKTLAQPAMEKLKASGLTL
jgi:FkbM family methyltransferase